MWSPKRFLLVTLLTPVVAGVAYTFHAMLTPTLGNFVGYADAQPTLEFHQPVPEPAPNSVLRQIRDLACACFDNTPQLDKLYWPQPARIEERADCWLVSFASKTPVYEWLGLRHELTPSDPAIYLSIAKSDRSLRWGKWCQ